MTVRSPVGASVSRREQLLAEAARLFATRGFRGVSMDDIGAAAGISGPGIYRHFPSKEQILAALLVGISEYLLDGAERLRQEWADGTGGGEPLLDRLVAFHADFSVGNPDLIVVHGQDLDSLGESSRRQVRRLQRTYVEAWVDTLREEDPGLSPDEALARAHAVFGLLNATPRLPAGTDGIRALLSRLALAALRS